MSLKELMIEQLKIEIREKAASQFKSAFERDPIIEAASDLIADLAQASKILSPIFPPSWSIARLYYDIYKEVVMSKIGTYITHMDKHVESDHGLLLSILYFA